MKKSIITLVLVVASLIGYSQNFSYKLDNWITTSDLVDNGDNTSSQSIEVYVSIVGEPYGFAPSTPNKNMFVVIIPNKTKDIDWIKAYINDQAILYVKATYPDTK